MDESERAAHYEQSRGDPTEWEEPEQSGRPGHRLGAMFSVRLQPHELDSIRALAMRRGLSVSAFLRDAALQAVAAEPVSDSCDACGRSWTASAYVHICNWPTGRLAAVGSLDQVARVV